LIDTARFKTIRISLDKKTISKTSTKIKTKEIINQKNPGREVVVKLKLWVGGTYLEGSSKSPQ